MRKIITLFAIAASVILNVYAQDSLKAVKMFEIDTVGIGSLSRMYVDSVGAKDESAVFYFYSKIDSNEKIIRTDIEGNIIDITDSPAYSCYTVYNGDTLYIDDHGTMVNATSGDTITSVGVPQGFAASPSGIFVLHCNVGKRTIPYYLQNILNNNTLWSFKNQGVLNVSGFCYGEGKVYMLTRMNGGMGKLTYMNEDGSDRKQVIVPVLNASGIGVYRGSLYVYSKTENAVYRIEPSDETRVYSVLETGINTEPIHYGLDGRMIESSTPGIHILKYPDGSVNKIVVR
jgi:hypothetical protein